MITQDYGEWAKERIQKLKTEIEKEEAKGRQADPFKIDMLMKKVWRYENS